MGHRREFDYPSIYHIRIRGTLGEAWHDRFDDFTITLLANGESVLAGPVADQSALFGVLACIRGLGLSLISLERLEGQPREAAE